MSLDKAIIVTYEKNGERFEVYVNPDMAYAYLEGKKKDLKNILEIEEVYKDARKGEKQSTEKLLKVFGTTDIYHILEIMLKEGHIPLTTEKRRQMVEEKKKKIIDMIIREAIDPRTNAPYTPKRIEEAMEMAKIHVDPFKAPEQQVAEILKKLRTVIPIKTEKKKLEVIIPPTHVYKAMKLIKGYTVIKEDWLSNGSAKYLIEVPAGIATELIDKISSLTSGEAQIREVE